jgi:hypothetical protein
MWSPGAVAGFVLSCWFGTRVDARCCLGRFRGRVLGAVAVLYRAVARPRVTMRSCIRWVGWPQLRLLLSNVVMGSLWSALVYGLHSVFFFFFSLFAGYGGGILVCWPVSGMRRVGAVFFSRASLLLDAGGWAPSLARIFPLGRFASSSPICVFHYFASLSVGLRLVLSVVRCGSTRRRGARLQGLLR